MKIQKVIPIEGGELVIRFDNGEFRVFPNQGLSDTEIWFLHFPHKLQSYVEHADGLRWDAVNKSQIWNGKNVWDGEVSLSASQLWDMSDEISLEKRQSKLLPIAMKNQAPTKQHSTHHVYFVYINPFNAEKLLTFGESIAGGHGERGGAISLSRSALNEFEQWQNHSLLAGCDWLIPILKEDNQTDEQTIDRIIAQFRQAKPQ